MSVFTKDGIELPRLPWSDDPRHILAQRDTHEETSSQIEAMISLSNAIGMHRDCPIANCRRHKTCRGSQIATSGRKAGLFCKPPYCIEVNREDIREILLECGLRPSV
jgi:hypothetical protein